MGAFRLSELTLIFQLEEIPSNRWMYAPRGYIGYSRIDRYCVPHNRVNVYYQRQRPVTNVYVYNNVRYDRGPGRNFDNRVAGMTTGIIITTAADPTGGRNITTTIMEGPTEDRDIITIIMKGQIQEGHRIITSQSKVLENRRPEINNRPDNNRPEVVTRPQVTRPDVRPQTSQTRCNESF